MRVFVIGVLLAFFVAVAFGGTQEKQQEAFMTIRVTPDSGRTYHVIGRPLLRGGSWSLGLRGLNGDTIPYMDATWPVVWCAQPSMRIGE